MTSKGQVTAFIVLGIVIVLLVGVLLFSQNVQKEQQQQAGIQESVAATADGMAVSQFIKGCMDTTAKSGVLLAGLQGGYTDVPPNYFSSAYSDIPYYYDKGQVSVVKTADIENQIERFMASNMKVCIGNFSTFTEKGVAVTAGSPTTNVTINPITGMSVIMNYDVAVGTGNVQENLKIFKTSYNLRIGTVQEVAQKLVDKIAADPKIIPVTYITELSDQYNVKIDSFSYGSDKIIYVINDAESMVEGDTPLLFLFATRINLENSLPVMIVDETKLTGKIGQEFNLTVEATDADYDPIEFYTDLNIIWIDPLLGEIQFIPETAGQYTFNVIATDGKGNTTKQLTITII